MTLFLYHQLQQFRQKKENKGSASHGKTSKKSGKAEQHETDDDASSTTSIPIASSQVTEKEIAAHDDSDLEIVDLPVSHSMGEPDMSLIQLREDQVTDVGCALLLLMLISKYN